MPIIHSCKACGSKVPETEIQSGKATRRGRHTYCAECSALLTASAVRGASHAPQARRASHAPRRENLLEKLESGPALQALPDLMNGSSAPAPLSRPRPGIAPNVARPAAPLENQPAQPAQPVAAVEQENFEVLEEFEILSVSDDSENDAENERENEPQAAPPAEPKAAPAKPASRRRLSRRRGARVSSRGNAGRGATQPRVKAASRRQEAARSSKTSAARSKAPLRRQSQRGLKNKKDQKREVFYRSGAQNRALHADAVAKVHEDVVDSSVLQAVKRKKEQARELRHANAKASPPASSRSRILVEKSSQRLSRRVSGRGVGGQDNTTQIILAAAAGLLVLLGLAWAVSGDSSSARRKSNPSVDSAYQSASYYVRKAQKLLKQGDRFGAAKQYGLAAEAAERAGNSQDAVHYQQAAYGLDKHTPINVRRR